MAVKGELDKLDDAVGLVIVPPAIQGIGNSGGFTMQVELRDGSFDMASYRAALSARGLTPEGCSLRWQEVPLDGVIAKRRRGR